MNDLQVAALVAGLAAILFLIAAFRSGHERQHRALMAAGLTLLAVMFALVMFDMGRFIEGLGNAAEQLQSDLGQP